MLSVMAAAALAFGYSLAGSFHFDDYSLFGDPAVTSASGWIDCFRLLRIRPLTYLTYWLNYQLGGEAAPGYHAANLALHLANSALGFLVLRRLLPEPAA